MDWSDRIKRAGYKVWVNMQALVYHKESISVGKGSALKEYFMTRNRILFTRRNAKMFQQIVFYFHYLFLVSPRNIISYIKNGNPSFIKQLLRAIWWNISNDIDSTYLGYKE